MRIFISLLLIGFCFSTSSIAQKNYFTITGIVIDASTQLPLQGASVFAENSTLGTATNQDGKFVLYLPSGGYNLVASFSGYGTQTIRINNEDKTPLRLELSIKEKNLQEVSIVSNNEVKNGWEKYGSFFLDEFIGKSANSEHCQLKNPEAVKFYYSKRKNRLKILANEPLIITNGALGYRIKYELDSFVHEYNNETSVYSGYPLFQEINDTTSEQIAMWKAARKKAYQGSILHFMRSIYSMQLQEEGFQITFVQKEKEKDTAIPIKNYEEALRYETNDSINYVKTTPIQPFIGVLFTNEVPAEKYLKENPEEPAKFQFSVLNFPSNKSVFIEENGYYYEQNDITVSGYWSWEKMANALPYDYTDN